MRASSRDDRIERMRAVERECQVAIIAKDILMGTLKSDPSTLTRKNLERSDLESLELNLEPTYLIRLFAEFETGVRSYWKTIPGKRPNVRVRDLIESVANRHYANDELKTDVHTVRAYRNRLLHEEDDEAEPVDLADARSYLCRFFSHLPEDW